MSFFRFWFFFPLRSARVSGGHLRSAPSLNSVFELFPQNYGGGPEEKAAAVAAAATASTGWCSPALPTDVGTATTKRSPSPSTSELRGGGGRQNDEGRATGMARARPRSWTGGKRVWRAP